MVELTNAMRARSGLPPLKAIDGLMACAQSHAEDMARNHYFSHSDRSGGAPWDRARKAGYDFCHAENIALGHPNAEEVVQGWMLSPGHRANILSPKSREIGVGYAAAGSRRYWVQTFGGKEDRFPLVINEEAARTASPQVRLYIYGEGLANQMRLSNDGRNFGPWEPFRSRADWTLEPGQGMRTVYVELSDGNGGLRTAWDSILLTPAGQ